MFFFVPVKYVIFKLNKERPYFFLHQAKKDKLEELVLPLTLALSFSSPFIN